MPPIVYQHPIKRPGFLQNARFEGTDDRLRFVVEYPDILGVLQTISFRLFDDGADKQEMCIDPSKYDLNNISQDTLVAHMRMASMIADTVPTSKEWNDSMQVEGPLQTKYFQTAVGAVKMLSASLVSEALFSVLLQRGNTQNQKSVEVGYSEVSKDGYVFAPSTQLLVIPGSVLKQFPTGHVHDYPGDILTAQERGEIVSYVNGLALWI